MYFFDVGESVLSAGKHSSFFLLILCWSVFVISAQVDVCNRHLFRRTNQNKNIEAVKPCSNSRLCKCSRWVSSLGIIMLAKIDLQEYFEGHNQGSVGSISHGFELLTLTTPLIARDSLRPQFQMFLCTRSLSALSASYSWRPTFVATTYQPCHSFCPPPHPPSPQSP